MIEGIEILNKTEILRYTDGSFKLALCLFVFGFLSVMIFSALASRFSSWFYIGSITGLIMIFSMMLITIFAEQKPTGRYQYEVTIDESVLFEDVIENYNIVDQKGELFVLEDK